MSDLVVYGSHLSPFVRKVEVALTHIDQPYEFVDVNIMAMPDWFVEISPMRRIPVLRDKSIGEEGVPGTIPDSSAIILFLEKKFGGGLYGESAYEAGQAAAIEEYADTIFAMEIGMGLFRPIIFPLFAGKEVDRETASKTWSDKLPIMFAYFETKLDGREFFVGDKITIADIAVAAQLCQIDLVAGLPDESEYPSLIKHVKAMKAHPGFSENLGVCTKMLGGILPEKVDLR